jgi:hypothetical protein
MKFLNVLFYTLLLEISGNSFSLIYSDVLRCTQLNSTKHPISGFARYLRLPYLTDKRLNSSVTKSRKSR